MRAPFLNPVVPPGYRVRVALFLVVLLCAIALTGCSGDGSRPKVVEATPAATTETPAKMHSLTVNPAAVAGSGATGSAAPGAASGAGVATAAHAAPAPNEPGAAILIQSRSGTGNTQIMDVRATGGTVAQTQSGSGNVQQLRIGVTDGPAPRP